VIFSIRAIDVLALFSWTVAAINLAFCLSWNMMKNAPATTAIDLVALKPWIMTEKSINGD